MLSAAGLAENARLALDVVLFRVREILRDGDQRPHRSLGRHTAIFLPFRMPLGAATAAFQARPETIAFLVKKGHEYRS
jgi:hypothetical protein